MGDSASAIVRTFNSGRTLETCLMSLQRQTVRPEIIVVDSGSTDETLHIAGRLADRVLRIAHDEFTYGRALNLGAREATGDFHFAMSSHCKAPDDAWIETGLRHFARPEVAGVNGQTSKPDGSPLTEPLDVTVATHVPNPYWSFSNHASGWRGSVWADFPFDEQLPGSEDTQWADRVVAAGHTLVFDPALTVPGLHRLTQGPRDLYRRRRREVMATAMVRRVPPLSTRAAVRRWWDTEPGRSRLRQLANPLRFAQIAGEWSARRHAGG